MTALTGCALTPAERFWARVTKGSGCWEWQGARGPLGYGVFRLGGKNQRAHRAAWILQVGPIPDGKAVLHGCDNPPCVRVGEGHLHLGDHALNQSEKLARGRQARGPALSALVRGERSGCNKVTERQVREIRARADAGEAQRALAVEFCVAQQTISDIVRRRRWGHVT